MVCNHFQRIIMAIEAVQTERQIHSIELSLFAI